MIGRSFGMALAVIVSLGAITSVLAQESVSCAQPASEARSSVILAAPADGDAAAPGAACDPAMAQVWGLGAAGVAPAGSGPPAEGTWGVGAAGVVVIDTTARGFGAAGTDWTERGSVVASMTAMPDTGTGSGQGIAQAWAILAVLAGGAVSAGVATRTARPRLALGPGLPAR